MPVVDSISSTRIQTWEDCPRKWWYTHARGFEDAASKSSKELGTQVHAEVEYYLGTGEWHEYPQDHEFWMANRIGRQGMEPWLNEETGEYEDAPLPILRDLVARGVGKVEAPFDLGHELGPMRFTGRIDFRRDDYPAIVDHKTSKNLRAYWHLDEMGLANNTQVLMYSAAAWGLNRIPERVSVSHIYYSTVLPFECRVLTATVSREKILSKVEEVRRIVELARKASFEEDPRKIEANAGACSKYGGCPHRDYCPDSTTAIKRREAEILANRDPLWAPREGTMFGKKKAAEKPQDTANVAAGQVNPPDGPSETEEKLRAVRARIQRIVNSAHEAPTADFVKMLLIEAELPTDGLGELLDFGRSLVADQNPTPAGKKAEPASDGPDDLGDVIKLLHLLKAKSSGVRAISGLVKETGLPADRIGQLVEAVRDVFDDFWHISEDNDDSIPMLVLDGDPADYDIEEIEKELVGAKTGDEAPPAPATAPKTRDELLARFNELEKMHGPAAKALAEKLGIKQPRKTGDEKLAALVAELEKLGETAVPPTQAPPVSMAEVGKWIEGKGGKASLVDLKSWLKGHNWVPNGDTFFAWLGSLADALGTDHDTNHVWLRTLAEEADDARGEPAGKVPQIRTTGTSLGSALQYLAAVCDGELVADPARVTAAAALLAYWRQ